MEEKAYDLWTDIICSCASFDSVSDSYAYFYYYSGIITLIRNLGVSESFCKRLWADIVDTAREIFHVEVICL